MQKKLYVVTRADLGLQYAGVQAGHGVAQWMLENDSKEWNNTCLIYLAVENEQQLEKLKNKLEYKEMSFSTFHEPDIGDQLTSISSFAEPSHFKNLKLLGP